MVGLLIVLLVVVAVAVAAWWFVFLRPLPKTSGRQVVTGLHAPVEILRDKHGIPHIFASSVEDALFAQGYVHVQDRLFQMELNRRVGHGRLAELFGPMAVDADRFLRRMGLSRAAQRETADLFPEERAAAEAYCRGVNAGMSNLSALPAEMTLLGITPEPWTVEDSLVWGKVLALNLSTNWDNELFRYRLIQKLGVDEAMKLELRYPHGVATVIPPGGVHDSDAAAAELQKLYAEAAKFVPLGMPGASNNWVVSGARTKSGRPMLANDPHLLLQVPNVWYEVHLVAPGLDVYGASFPGDPGVVLGHSRHVAWGFTNSGADVQDLFLEKFNPENRHEALYMGVFEKVTVLNEIIKVKGGDDVVEEVRLTRHGPVIAGGNRAGELGLSLKWSAHESGHLFSALLSMNQAKSAAEFKEACRKWHTPSQNIVFADDAGNIGYVMAGAVPIRKNGSGLTPVPGWTNEYEWTGYVPFEELPQAWNPESGYVVTANNAVVDRKFKHHITWDWMNGYRAGRIEQLLTARRKLDADDFRDIQMDVYSAPGKAFSEACATLRPVEVREQLALGALRRWDGHETKDSVGATIYETMSLFVLERAIRPRIGRELFEDMIGKAAHPLAPAGLIAGRYTGYVMDAVKRRDPEFLKASPGYSSWDVLLAASLKDACELLTKLLGDDVQRWTWGRLHQVQLRHPMGRVKLLGLIFNAPSVPIGGGADSPLQTAMAPHQSFGADAWAPSWRQIVDFADIKKTRSVNASGQSGHRGSPHYLDQFPLWYDGGHHAQWLDRADIEANLEARLLLVRTQA